MDGINDYLQKKAQELGLERGDQLHEIQKYLDELYPGLCRAASINEGILKIIVVNASVASELRFRKAELLQHPAVYAAGVIKIILTIA
jgi:hypothetical protein